ncbi:hypothetical protein GH714_029042 [Hevea brasiliensis]|uniref:Cytochrome P450 n=1 Tax=Hevea brasiliensis TaxID=3981 RepID=A0A6A6LF22_HEVBR|nr:hypothetical protein GH714_029042 [Hevea brasiliensis]
MEIPKIMNMRNEVLKSSPMELSHQLLPRVQPHIYSWIKLYGKNFLCWYGPQAQLMVTEPELIKEVLSNRDGDYPKIQFDAYMKKLLGNGTVTAQGENWVNLRKLSNHAFHAECLKGMIPAMITSVEMMLERWRHHDGKEIEVFQEFKVLASEIISRTAFGSSYLEGEQIIDMLTKIAHLISKNRYKIRIPGVGKFVKTCDDVESEKLEQGIRNCILNMIKKREESVITGRLESYGNDFLGLLVKANHDADKRMKLSVDDVIDECKTFYVGGHETTTSLLAWTVLLLAIHMDWQDKARKEVVELFGKQNPTPDGISRLKIMCMIVNESLRLYPPVVNLARQIHDKVVLGNLILPAKVQVSIPILAIHHDPQIWGEDVDLFKPKRFAQGVAKATNNNIAAFLPFGLGPRNCVGSNFAVTEAKIALSMILQHYRFTLSPTYVHSPAYLLTMNPKHGIQVKLQAL